MKNRSLKLVRTIFPWIVTITIGFILFKSVNFDDFWLAFSKTNFVILLLAVVCSVFSTLFVCVYKYKYTLRFLGYNIPISEARIIKLGNLPLKSVTPFKAGEFFRTIYLKKNFNIPYKKGVLSIILGYLLRFLVLGVFILAGWLISVSNVWIGLSISLSVFALAVVVLGLKNFKLFFYSFLLELCLILNYYIALEAFSIEVPLTSFLFFIPLILLLESLPISIAGLGVREGLLTLFFVNAAGYEKLLACGITVSFVNGLIPVFLGLLFMRRFITEFTFKREVTELDPNVYLKKRKGNFLTRYRFRKRVEEISSAIKQYKNMQRINLLDIGAADGIMLSILNSKLNLGKAVGIEPSSELRSAKKDYGIEILEGEGENLPFKENEFDVVILASVIEHVKDVKRVISESQRVLKEHGLLVITAVNPFFDKMATFLGFKANDHLQTYNLDDLKKMFAESSSRVKLAKRFGPLFYQLIVAEKVKSSE